MNETMATFERIDPTREVAPSMQSGKACSVGRGVSGASGPVHESATEKLLARSKFNWASPPSQPAPVFQLGKTAVSTRGNLTTITGQPKSGKSSFVAAMIAATMARIDNADTLHVCSSNHDRRAVVHFDTEQDPRRHHSMLSGAVERAGLGEPPEWLHSFALKGTRADELRTAVDVALHRCASQHNGIHSVFVDGVADLVSDPNRGEECIDCVTWLEQLAVDHDTPIIGVLHLNPGAVGGGLKGRGHLGSQMERKAETEIRLRRDRDKAISVWTHLARAEPVNAENALRFRWDEHRGRHASTDSLAEDTKLRKLAPIYEQAEQVAALKNGLTFGAFVREWATTHNVAAKTAESRFTCLRREGLIYKVGELWTLKTS